jgi:hypothetical protein
MIRMIKSRRMRWAGRVIRTVRRGMHRGHTWESQKKRTTRKTRRRWVDNNEIDLREIEWDGIDWIDLGEDKDHWRALLNTAMNIRVP